MKKKLSSKQIWELLLEGIKLKSQEHKKLAKFTRVKPEDLAIRLK